MLLLIHSFLHPETLVLDNQCCFSFINSCIQQHWLSIKNVAHIHVHSCHVLIHTISRTLFAHVHRFMMNLKKCGRKSDDFFLESYVQERKLSGNLYLCFISIAKSSLPFTPYFSPSSRNSANPTRK